MLLSLSLDCWGVSFQSRLSIQPKDPGSALTSTFLLLARNSPIYLFLCDGRWLEWMACVPRESKHQKRSANPLYLCLGHVLIRRSPSGNNPSSTSAMDVNLDRVEYSKAITNTAGKVS